MTVNSVSPGRIRLGTRSSALALWQANHVRDLISAQWGRDVDVELITITTRGDQIRDRPLSEIGGKGVFVKAIEQGLLDGAIDLAVHSMKDLPSTMPSGLMVAATPEREDPRDALVTADGQGSLSELPRGTRLGTGSLRRGALARRINPGLELVPLRGNVPTRLEKCAQGQCDAVLLACAGLKRLGLADRITEALSVDSFCPSPCQGILALQCRSSDERVRAVITPLEHGPTARVAAAERSFLSRLEADCDVPLGCHARLLDEHRLAIGAVIVDPSGEPHFSASEVGAPGEAAVLGRKLAEALLAMGAGVVLERH